MAAFLLLSLGRGGQSPSSAAGQPLTTRCPPGPPERWTEKGLEEGKSVCLCPEKACLLPKRPLGGKCTRNQKHLEKARVAAMC